MSEKVEYDKDSPLVQAIERGYEDWVKAGKCKDVGCGCVTVYIHREVVKLLSEKALMLAAALVGK